MPNFLDFLSPFKGTMAETLPHNWLLPGKPNMPGWPAAIARNASKGAVGFDFTLMKWMSSLIESKGIVFLGDQGIGKTFAVYLLLLLWSGESTGSRPGTISIDSFKHNNDGLPETYALVTKLLKCTIIRPLFLRMNPLSRAWDFTLQEQFTMVVTKLEVISGLRMSDVKRYVLNEVLAINYKSARPSYPNLVRLLNEYKSEERLNSEERLSLWEAERSEDDTSTYVDKLFDERKALFYEDAAMELVPMVQNLTTGMFGDIFAETDDEELIPLLSQRAQSWDFKNVPVEVQAVIEVFRATIEASALGPVDPYDEHSPAKHPERVAQYIARDEAQRRWAIPIFGDNEFDRMTTLREGDITVVTLLQRLSHLLSSVSSAKGRNMLRENRIWIVGRQTTADIPDLLQFLELPEYIIRTLPTLAKGHFWVFMPGADPLLLFFLGTEDAITNFVTNQANEALLLDYLQTENHGLYIKLLEDTSPEPEKDVEANLERMLANVSSNTPQV